MYKYHFVHGNSIVAPYPKNSALALFGLGCFWGPEKIFWKLPGVYSTAVGYSGGTVSNPTYNKVCAELTGHAEVVLVIFLPSKVSYEELLKVFWESHDPTQGMKQGPDIGSQYRSIIIPYDDEQYDLAIKSRIKYSRLLRSSGFDDITTEVTKYINFYYAEDYHQQYLSKNPNGYCCMAGTGVSYL
tara:strand:+ start:44949 stop:45506 length:558 start_codon:yes stop_codon:yes gene_type:complete